MAVVPGGCGSAVVAYADRLGARETQVEFVRVQLYGAQVVTPLPGSGTVEGWVNHCTARADGSAACTGGLGYIYGPFAGGWVGLLDADGNLPWSVKNASRTDSGIFPTALSSADDGSLFIGSRAEELGQTVRLERVATVSTDGWRVELPAATLEADMVDVGALAVSEEGELLSAGGRSAGGWWSPWLAKHDAAGELLWSKGLPTKPDTDLLVRDVALLPSGVAVLAAGFGTTGNDTESRAGQGQLTAFTSNGEQLWSLESDAHESIEALLVDANGHLLTLGTYAFLASADVCQPDDSTCEKRTLMLREYNDQGAEQWSRRYEMGANEPPQFKQPSLVRGAWVDDQLVVVGWNAADGQPWLGSIAY